jgi:nicotinate phosphoribosyltransferase
VTSRPAAAPDVPSAVPPDVPWAVPPALVTDLYELTMAAAYQRAGLEHEATFELFVRSLPSERRFLVAAGLVEDLAGRSFSGEVWAVPEGEVVFAGEPLVRVTAPLVEAQMVETWLLNRVASQTTLASKAARVALACGDRSFVDFSARRDHGVDAALAAARAAWITGAAGTSLVAAGRRWGIPLSGTMAHSFVMSYDDEVDAFRAYARSFPDRVVLLIDTYDTVEGARRAARVARELAREGIAIAGVRLASGDLDEHRIAALLAAGAPIDAFGVGTQLGTSADAPALGAVYKLVEDADGPKMKLASGKVTLPGRKQVWRLSDRDVVSLHDEEVPGGRPLLVQVMSKGQRTRPESLATVRDRCTATLADLPGPLRSLEMADHPVWPIETSAGLADLAGRVQAGLRSGEGGG